ncbi:MAG: ferredoxin-type protein NapH [Clostridium butyricum]|uniref:4Fe-4S binding protein n=1 Tax=Clostridium butyricum TaxID=1492 RepID=A0A6L9ESA8_CLOBU|nr:4Fe-4S binding protein [Clostridium butyricum]MDK2829758.1 ferredoxin-type protein NapH [Clostridium butyricum]NAS19443.1 4Fe-4S binding protein [Clostridium butyricum]NOW22751.1 polyferredoxin [Clostridium butyricum]
MKRALQSIIQITFFILFIFLFIKGKMHAWILLLLLGIFASFLLGRIYCGWICSINTVMKGITWIKNKLHIKSLEIPQFFTKPWIRFLTLGLFITVFIFTMATGRKLPVFPVLFAICVILTFLFPEELWHRYLCPFGIIMSLPSSKAKHFMSINANKCINCGVCKAVCPAKAVKKDNKHHEIIKSDCLVCMKCSRNCKQNAISYK